MLKVRSIPLSYLNFAEELTFNMKGKLSGTLYSITLSPAVHDKFTCEVGFTPETSIPLHTHTYSAAQSHKAQVERESVFKVISLCLRTTSETVGENERVKKQDRRLGGVGGAPMMLKLTDVSHGWPHPWIPLRWTDSDWEPVAGGCGEEGFCVGRTVPGGTARKSSAPGFGEAEVCWRRPRWSPVCDTLALLAPCAGRREWSTIDERCISTCCQLTVYSAKQGVKTRDKNMAWVRLCPPCFAKCVYL